MLLLSAAVLAIGDRRIGVTRVFIADRRSLRSLHFERIAGLPHSTRNLASTREYPRPSGVLA
jgi:hypothetical protein